MFASGSGDLAITATELVKPAGAVVMCDINDRMLEMEGVVVLMKVR